MRPGCRAPALVTLLLLLLGCPPAGADETAPPPPATDLCTLLQLPFVPATCVTTDESQARTAALRLS